MHEHLAPARFSVHDRRLHRAFLTERARAIDVLSPSARARRCFCLERRFRAVQYCNRFLRAIVPAQPS
jgi:hypothetical protein